MNLNELPLHPMPSTSSLIARDRILRALLAVDLARDVEPGSARCQCGICDLGA